MMIIILILSAVLRLFVIGSAPAGLNADEAALGYNAYSLMLTGKDEHGHSWPVNLESFGDFKPALYAYMLIPFVKIFGLTEFAVRLPSAIFGVLGVWGIYLLTKKIFEKLNIGNSLVIGIWSLRIEEMAALLLAISPWHLHFSRGAWEVNVATTMLIWGVWAFLSNRFAFSILTFVLSMYTYQSTRLIAPLLGLGLVILYPKKIHIPSLLLLLLLLPLGYSLVTSNAGSRLSGVGLLADAGPENRSIELRGQHKSWNTIFVRLLHNKPTEYVWRFAKNYLDHWDGNFLFVNGDVIARNRVPETGLFYITDFIFLCLGIWSLVIARKPETRIIWFWLAIAPLAAAMTFQTPHALRSHNMVVPMIIIISVGVFEILKHWKFFGICVLGFVYLWQVSRYLHEYYVHYPQTYPAAWQYGFKEVVTYAESVKDRYDQILVTDKYDQPYILFLFYSRYLPAKFQNNHQLTVRDRFNFSTVRQYDKYHFTSTNWDKVRDIHSALIIAAPEDIPDVGVNVVKTILFPNGQPAFKIVSN